MTIHLIGFSLDTTTAEFYAKRHLHNAIKSLETIEEITRVHFGASFRNTQKHT